MKELLLLPFGFMLATGAACSAPTLDRSADTNVLDSVTRSEPWPQTIRAADCLIKALNGRFAKVDSPAGKEILVSTDAAGNAIHAMGEIQFSFPGAIPDGSYRLTVKWRTGTMGGTPWSYRLGSDAGSVTENGVTDGAWHYFYPGHAGSHSDQSFTHDLAGPDPVDFSMWPNSPVAVSITVNGIGPGEFFIRLRDLSPARDNSFRIESFVLTPIVESGVSDE